MKLTQGRDDVSCRVILTWTFYEIAGSSLSALAGTGSPTTTREQGYRALAGLDRAVAAGLAAVAPLREVGPTTIDWTIYKV